MSWKLIRVPRARRSTGLRPFFLHETIVGYSDYGPYPRQQVWYVGWFKLSHTMGEKPR